MTRSLWIFSFFLAGLSTSFGWSDEGHNAIWEVAQHHLTPKAKARVDQILAGSQLEYTATWLDRARDAAKSPPTGPFATDPETVAFNSTFQDNAQWHYVDLPAGAHSYAESTGFAGRSDVVHHINQAIAVLEGSDHAMTPSIALRDLIHLVGDIHQPLHCVAGFFNTHDPEHPVLVEGMAAARFKPFGDRGGNLLFYGVNPFDQLHAFFDSHLVADLVPGGTSHQELASAIEALLATEKANTAGDYHTWAEKWADESLQLANDAYGQLTFGHVTWKTDANGRQTIKSIAITFPTDFEKRETAVVSHRLARAAARLSDLLNRILDPQ